MHFISTVVTFCVFFIEGLLHYNIGLNSRKTNLSTIKIGFPSMKSLFSMILVLCIFSAMNGYIINAVTEWEESLAQAGHNHEHEENEKKNPKTKPIGLIMPDSIPTEK